MKTALYILLIALVFVGCKNSSEEFPSHYLVELEEWRSDRDVKLRAENGFVNLVGLYWLEEGESTIGSSPDNKIVFPEKTKDKIGVVTLKNGIVKFECDMGIEVVVDSFCLEGGTIFNKKEKSQSIQKHGSFEWHIIERAGNYGIRLRDLEHEMVSTPLNLTYYHVSKDWIVKAQYNKFETPKSISIDNIVGFNFNEPIEGELNFEIDGKPYSLLPSIGETGMFIMFADETSGLATYGSGRYLSADLPDKDGIVILDFNKAYNPPCAFTDYATCPLPPRENILDVKVEAGEKEWHQESK